MLQIDYNPTPKTLRSFGLISLVLFPVLALAARYGWFIFYFTTAANAWLVWIFLALGILCGLGALIAPMSLKPIYIGMSYIGVPIGTVVLYIMLAFTYFLVITPIALIFRLIGRDAMHRKFEPAATTYWIKRVPTRDVKRYFRQF